MSKRKSEIAGANTNNKKMKGPQEERKLSEELRSLQSAVAKGDPEAMSKLGFCYEEGKGVEKDEKEAVAAYLFTISGDI